MRKILQYTYISLLFVLVLYLSIFARNNPTHFVYTNSPTAIYTGGEPIIDCNVIDSYKPIERMQVNGCAVTNVPKGQENIYVKESNPFMYWIIQNDFAVVGLALLLYILFFGVELQAKLAKLSADLKADEDLKK